MVSLRQEVGPRSKRQLRSVGDRNREAARRASRRAAAADLGGAGVADAVRRRVFRQNDAELTAAAAGEGAPEKEEEEDSLTLYWQAPGTGTELLVGLRGAPAAREAVVRDLWNVGIALLGLPSEMGS